MPATFAKVYDKSGEKNVILNVRTWVLQPFEALNWLDLRVGFLLSLTKADDDDDPSGIGEVMTGSALPPDQHCWIGIKDSSTLMPNTSGSVFIGYNNTLLTVVTGKLLTSDEEIGTTNANFWRPQADDFDVGGGMASIFDGKAIRAAAADNAQPHFAQDPSGAGGYATMLAMRITRPSSASKTVTVELPQGTHNGNLLMTDTPTEESLLSNLVGFPTTVQQLGPSTLSQVPDALYLYWPFHNSRLRIHAMGIAKIL